jgi:HAMP domain-containing protein
MLKSLQIATKSSLSRKMATILLVIFISSLAIVLTLLNFLLEGQAVSRIDQQSNLIMDSLIAVRQYTSKYVNPIVAPINKNNIEFLPEAVPSYSATTVFSLLKEGQSYANYSYREATLNPTNLKDKADSLEAQIIQEFRSNPTMKIKTGERRTPVGNFHYIARPLKVSSQSCLVCHSTPDLAPKSQLLTYGKNNGFGWKLGETIGSQIVTVPVDEIYVSKWNSLLSLTTLVGLSFVVVGLATLYVLQKSVLKPIRLMSARADQASIQPESIEFSEKLRGDEIGSIAKSLERMKHSLVISMRLLGEKNK